MRRPLSTALILAAVALPTLAAAQTRTEAQAQLGAEFKATDTNGDGVLERGEIAKRIGAMHVQGKSGFSAKQASGLTTLWFTRADANKDGKVTRAEADGLMTRLFALYDTNGDGKITVEERQAAKARARAEINAKH